MHKFKNVNGYRSEKNTHISMVSNSVRHLRSYTNTAIVNIDGNSVPGTDIATPSASIVVLSTNVTLELGVLLEINLLKMFKFFSIILF